MFSLPPLLLIVISVAGGCAGRVETEIGDLIGPSAAEQVQTMIAQAAVSGSGNLSTALGLTALLFGATTAFAQLQSALNRAWEVKPDPNTNSVQNFLLKRVLSFGMILGIGFLLLVSLALNAALAAFGDAVSPYLPSYLSGHLLRAVSFALSLAVFTGLFARLYRNPGPSGSCVKKSASASVVRQAKCGFSKAMWQCHVK